MNVEKIMKKLEEIKVETLNNLHSSEEESELQIESETEEHNCEPAAGEEVKITRPKAEKVPEIKTLSRTTPMDGSKGVPEKIYVTDGTVKSITTEFIQAQLDDLKKEIPWKDPSRLQGKPKGIPLKPQKSSPEQWGGEMGKLVTRAELILEEAKVNPAKFNVNDLNMLSHELNRNPEPDMKNLRTVLAMFTEGL